MNDEMKKEAVAVAAPLEPQIVSELVMCVYGTNADVVIADHTVVQNGLADHLEAQHGQPKKVVQSLDAAINLNDANSVSAATNNFAQLVRRTNQLDRFKALQSKVRATETTTVRADHLYALNILQTAAGYAEAMMGTKSEITTDHYAFMDLYIKAASAVKGGGAN